MSWIKMNHDLADKPEVMNMASMLNIHRHEVIGHLWRLWTWADQQSLTGNAMCVTEALLNRVAERDGFASAMRDVGWLEGEDFALNFPNFERHNGKTAKGRALSANRSEVYRVTHPSRIRHARITRPSREQRDQRREEKSTEVRALSEQDDMITQLVPGHAPVTHPSRSNHAESVTKPLQENIQYAEAQVDCRKIALERFGLKITVWGQNPDYDFWLNRVIEQGVPRSQWEDFMWLYSLDDNDPIINGANHLTWRRQKFDPVLEFLSGEIQKAVGARKKYDANLGDIDAIP